MEMLLPWIDMISNVIGVLIIRIVMVGLGNGIVTAKIRTQRSHVVFIYFF